MGMVEQHLRYKSAIVHSQHGVFQDVLGFLSDLGRQVLGRYDKPMSLSAGEINRLKTSGFKVEVLKP